MTGSARYPGAAVLSSAAAARTNTGMVRYLGPQRAQDMVLSSLPEAVIGKGRVQSWVVGSGVPAGDDEASDSDFQRKTIAALLKHYALPQEADLGDDVDAKHAGALDMPPIVVDAGALDLLPDKVPAQVVVTPHAGELAHMLTRLGKNEVGVDEVCSQPLACARKLHELTGATVLLKGAVTMVVGADGENNERVILSGRAPAWMSTAGSGDVLAGMLGALLAQQDDMLAEDPALVPEVVAAGAYMHGLAGAIASQSEQRGWHRPQIYGHSKKQHFGEIGHPIIASDIIDGIQPAFLQLL